MALPLLAEAKAVAAREGTTLRELVEAKRLRVLAERRGRDRCFKLRDASFGGNGLQSEFRDAGWDRIRDAAYEGRP